MNCAPADGLLLQLYGCCTDASRWPAVLDRLCAEVGARSAVVQALSTDGEKLNEFWMAHDSRTDVREYEALISNSGNPRLHVKRIPLGIGQVLEDKDIFAAEELPLQRRLQQQLVKLGLGSFMGGLHEMGPNRYLSIALHRPAREGDRFSTRERDRVGAMLPHLAQAVSVSEAVAPSRRIERLLSGHLDRWHCGLIVCDARGRAQWVNQRAAALLREGRALSLRDGHLRAATAQSQHRLELALAAQPLAGEPGYLALEHGGQRCHLAVKSADVPAGTVDRPPLMLTLTVDEPGGEIPAAALAVLFELTEAESRLTSALVAGDSLEQYALRRGVALGTVRYQLKRVLAKTGSSRQSDLVRRVLCSAAAYAAGVHAETGVARLQ